MPSLGGMAASLPRQLPAQREVLPVVGNRTGDGAC